MKHLNALATILVLQFFILCYAGTENKNNIVVIPIQKEIGSSTWNYTKNGLSLADSVDAKAIIIHMNTYGGQVVFADSIRTAILNSETPVHVFIDNNAASAGALISIACDSIYMREGATIGAATVVTQSGDKAIDKYQSYMRATIRATAEAQGKDTTIINGDTTISWRRNPQIAEAMVDQDIYIESVSDTGKLLTFTVNEALNNNYCEAKVGSIEEVIARLNIDNYEVIAYVPSTYDNIKGFLLNPVFHGILIMLILGGIYFELQSPGIGFPLLVSIIAAVLYFAPLYIDGLANYWEIALFIVGIILIALEVFVIPGFGIAGIAGATLAFLGLLLSMVNNVNFDFKGVETNALLVAIITTTLSIMVGTALMLWLTSKFWGEGRFTKLSLNANQPIKDGYIAVDINTDLIDKLGEAATDLRPSGKVLIDDKIYDGLAIIGLIEKGTKVVVKKQESGQLYVMEA